MQKTVYEDYKYVMQDVGTVYIGAKYTLGEILESEDVPFKFQLVTERYLLPEADREDTLETHLYYLDAKSFLVRIYRQLKARVKINVLEDHKTKEGVRKRYATRVLTVEELSAISPAEKEKKGIVVQELIVSKLAMMTF